MTSNKNIERSRRVYARMLYLFPREHREEYGTSMLQVFTDQLREIGQKDGVSGFIMLWLHTLWDLGISAIKEQFSPPHLTIGLLEAVPNQPLPWKGVALVLIPGIVFFIAQLVQLSGQDMFYWMFYRAGYFFIVPVLIIWAWRRKFPIWGLVPLGLLFRTLCELGYRAFFGRIFYAHPQLFYWLAKVKVSAEILRASVIFMAIAGILTLLIVFTRRHQLSRKAWHWLGAYILLCIAYLAGAYVSYSDTYYHGWKLLFDIAPSFLYGSAGFLVLILLGSLFARRHGRLAMLLLMGYLLPTVIYGRFGLYNDSIPQTVANNYLLLIMIAVLVYRFIIALAAPVWVVRSAAPGAKRKASLITLLICVSIQIVMNIGVNLFLYFNLQYTGFTWLVWYVSFAAELVMITGIGLATSLYNDPPQLAQSAADQTEALITA